MKFLHLWLWIIPHILVAFCLVDLLRSTRYKQFPFFYGYLIAEEAVFAFLFGIYLLKRVGASHLAGFLAIYPWVVVIGVAVSSCLQIAILYEVAHQLVLSRSTLAAALRFLLQWAAALFLLLAIGIGAAFSGSGIKSVNHVFEVLNFSANLVNLGLLLIFLLFTSALRISWNSLPAGIMLGFGLVSSAEVGATSLISALGDRGVVSADVVRTAGFLACTAVWLIYILLPDKNPQFTGQGLHKSEIELWDQELHRIVEQ